MLVIVGSGTDMNPSIPPFVEKRLDRDLDPIQLSGFGAVQDFAPDRRFIFYGDV